MKKESNEALESYKIRIDALEIINEAYLAKIEALELLNRNLQFLREVKMQSQNGKGNEAPVNSGQLSSSLATGEKKGRGRPRKYPVGTTYADMVRSGKIASAEKRGRGRPRKYPVGSMNGSPVALSETGEKRGRGRPRIYPIGSTPSTRVASLDESGNKRGRGRPRKIVVAGSSVSTIARKIPGLNRRGRKPKTSTGITRLQVPLEIALREMLHDESYNKATYRALSGILLCLFENKTATVATLHEYIGGSKVTVVRHTAALKKMKLITYEGSRKKGNYALTAQGNHLYDRLLNA